MMMFGRMFREVDERFDRSEGNLHDKKQNENDREWTPEEKKERLEKIRAFLKGQDWK